MEQVRLLHGTDGLEYTEGMALIRFKPHSETEGSVSITQRLHNCTISMVLDEKDCFTKTLQLLGIQIKQELQASRASHVT